MWYFVDLSEGYRRRGVAARNFVEISVILPGVFCIQTKELNQMKMVFQISTGDLYIQAPSISFTLPATSGRGGCMNNASMSCQRMMNEGPIPVGDYHIDPSDMSDPSFPRDVWRNIRPDLPGDWGDFRIKITPGPSTNTHARDGFFLHGGALLGSAGCIDVGGGLLGDERTNLLKLAISASTSRISLEVIA